MLPFCFLLFLVASASANMMKTFLQQSRMAVASHRPVVLCVGNEAADADSIVSSLCYGFLKHALRGEGATGISFVPVVSIPRNILKLRPETEILLKMVSLELDDLICVEDMDVSALNEKGQIEGLILTDHNVLSNKICGIFGTTSSQHESLVKEIVDHHIDSGAYAHVQGANRNIAFDKSSGRATAGSACTLVAEKLMDSRNSLDAEMKRSLSTLLCGVILIDTQNMASTGTGTERDATMLNMLLSSPDLLNDSWDRDAVFTQLRGAKMSTAFWTSLSAFQCLVIDYKEFPCTNLTPNPNGAQGSFGMSTIACRLGEFCGKEHCYEDMVAYLSSPSSGGEIDEAVPLDLLVVMASFVDGENCYKRELLVASLHEERLTSVHAYLTTAEPQLDLVPLLLQGQRPAGLPAGLHVKAYSQGNVRASRKQVAPLLSAYYSSL